MRIKKGKKGAKSTSSAYKNPGNNFMSDSDSDGEEQKIEDFGETAEEQRKGLWRSIFGYFRGPR